MTPAQKKVLEKLRKRKRTGISALDFDPRFNLNTRLSELRRMKINGEPMFNIVGRPTSSDNPAYTHWLISEAA